MTIALVLDASAIAAYTRRTEFVGELIARTADEGDEVLIPALSLATAYRDADRHAWPYLEVLISLPQLLVAPVEAARCRYIGRWARPIGSLELAQTAMEAAARGVVPIVTAHRTLLTRVLPPEWPILDLT